MSIHVLKPGLLTSVQDSGRHGHQHLGMPVCGAMDVRAHRLANLLAGNHTDEATLEITLNGPALRFDQPACIAICGAQLKPTLNGQPLPNDRPIVVREGDTLQFQGRLTGLRAYLAFYGGLAIEPVMNSRSTYLRGSLGGFQGRALKKGDTLALQRYLNTRRLPALEQALWNTRVYLPAALGLQARTRIRAMTTAHTPLFTDEAVAAFFEQPYEITAQSERMGYRLQGPTLRTRQARQYPSEVTGFGTVQVPPDGNPIVLMADRQTTGGYPKIAHIAAVDLPHIAQRMPGESIEFTPVSVSQARELDARREQAFQAVSDALAPLRTALANAAAS
ncbi:MAG: biotin-dependent carboxyltransferase family protein [Burkholderiaceae bacterium]